MLLAGLWPGFGVVRGQTGPAPRIEMKSSAPTPGDRRIMGHSAPLRSPRRKTHGHNKCLRSASADLCPGCRAISFLGRDRTSLETEPRPRLKRPFSLTREEGTHSKKGRHQWRSKATDETRGSRVWSRDFQHHHFTSTNVFPISQRALLSSQLRLR
ncbi:hypothetical protein SKAU_G00340510 [Synaphobranchus kaupii]|uniref:Uncharacterized protein n=1 Tax=Synaphobranchus kaupii TaxID=118154 RepID=A0A9Q1IIG6_SYNKA|nr:hypothetical protein SKAU_G00340510 [Synaphobranchus kaupii]